MDQRKRKRQNRTGTLEVLYEDRCVAVVSKPCGMISVPYNSSYDRGSAVGVLEEEMRARGTYSYSHRPLAVHRLDRDTSGVMMFALGEKQRRVIMEGWQSMVKERLYRAVVEVPTGKDALSCPLLYKDAGIIDLPLLADRYGRTYVPRGNKRYVADEKGELISAMTHYKVICRGEKYMLLELSLDTGRKNQIRAHLAALHCPVAGDKWRGSRTNPYNRLALHARTLAFIHPETREVMRFEVKESARWMQDCKRSL